MGIQLDLSEYEEVSKGYHPDPFSSWSLNARCYQDPMFLRLDQQQIFHRSWQFLCHESKLQETGSYIAADVQGQSIFATRDQNGELRAFYNVCKHRGHELVSGEGKKNLIVCPYHAWSYSLDGKLKAARRSEFLNDFNKSDICLDQVRIEVFCHLVFINLDANATPLAEQSEDLASEIMQYAPDLADLKFAHRLTYNIKANWKSVVDNFLECYHCPVAHKDFCTLVDMDTYKVKTPRNLFQPHGKGRTNGQQRLFRG